MYQQPVSVYLAWTPSSGGIIPHNAVVGGRDNTSREDIYIGMFYVFYLIIFILFYYIYLFMFYLFMVLIKRGANLFLHRTCVRQLFFLLD